MENYIFIFNTILGFALAIFIDLNKRNKESEASPRKFDLRFFIKDNSARFFLSITIMLLVFLNVSETAQLFGKEWTKLNNLVYALIGFAPDYVIAWAKRKAGFLQPREVEGYERKSKS